MIKLDYIPDGILDIEDWYGGLPAHIEGDTIVKDKEWYKENIQITKLPYAMRLSWDIESTITRHGFHQKVIPALIDALKEIRSYSGPSFLRKYDLDLFGGGFSTRFMKSGKYLSTHAWGIAIDINPHLGTYGERTRMPCFIVDAFTSRGFVNLRHDGMHFAGCKGY